MRPVRRLVGTLCGTVRVRRMRRRRPDWLLVLRCRHRVGRLRRLQRRLRRRLELREQPAMRWRRSRVRLQVTRCCRMVVAVRRLLVLRGRVLVVRVDRRSRRASQREQLCLTGADRHLSLVLRLRRRLVLVVGASTTSTRQLASPLVRR